MVAMKERFEVEQKDEQMGSQSVLTMAAVMIKLLDLLSVHKLENCSAVLRGFLWDKLLV
jgi:hypothetical protein